MEEKWKYRKTIAVQDEDCYNKKQTECRKQKLRKINKENPLKDTQIMNNICEKLLNKGFSYVLFIFFDLSESDIVSDTMRDIERCVYSG